MRQVTITCSHPEFDKVANHIAETYPNSCVLYLKKIEYDESELNDYENRKREISRKRGFVNEPLLYHGTHSDNIQSILDNGFDISKCTTCAYGKGIYFSKSAKYSKDYSKSHDPITYMFLCTVLVGKYKVGTSNEKLNLTEFDNFTDPGKTMYVTPYEDAIRIDYVVAFYKNA